jgi:HK97 family phage prohead protease
MDMPPKLERCVQHLMDQGHDEQSAYAICNHVLEMLAEPEEAKEQPETKNLSLEDVEPPRDRIRKFYVADTKALKNGDIEAYVSTESVDRVGDVIRTSGWQIDNYRKSGAPVLFSHDYSLPPIGNSVEMEAQRKGLWSVTRFHEKTQLSRDLAVLARGGLMKSWSVGFNPIGKPDMRKSEEGEFLGYIFNKQELLEYSLVPVPANPDAVSKALFMARKGRISSQLAAIFAGPSPSAEVDPGPDVRFPTQDEAFEDEHNAKLAGIHFLKRLIDGYEG